MKLGVIGAGECFTEKILPGITTTGEFSIEWVVDIVPEAEIRSRLEKAGLNSFTYNLTNGFLTEIPSISIDAIVDSAPNRYHAHNTELALNAGKHVYVEKPFATNEDGISKVENAITKNQGLLAYFTEYYRDEKGLPIRVLSGEIKPKDWQGQFMAGLDESLLHALASLGNVRYIRGTCLEGIGKKSGISHRLWVGDRDQGGMLLDMGMNLFTFLPILRSKIGCVSVDECVAGICRQAQDEYKQEIGNDIAETYAEVKLKSDKGTLIEFAFGKYTGSAERIFYIEADKGFVEMDFETQTMQVDSPVYRGEVKVISNPKYEIIMKDFVRRVKDQRFHFPYQFENSKETLKHILEAKRSVDSSRTFIYDNGDVPGIERFLKGQKRDYQ